MSPDGFNPTITEDEDVTEFLIFLFILPKCWHSLGYWGPNGANKLSTKLRPLPVVASLTSLGLLQ